MNMAKIAGRLFMAVASLVMAVASLTGCASATISSNRAPVIDMSAPWVMLPAINNTETPQAGGRLDSIASSLMRARGINLSMYMNAGQGDDGIFDMADRRQQQLALERVSKQGFHYAIAGSVNEWRYKTGAEGEPAAGISFSIIDITTGLVIWSGSAARTGSSQGAVSAMAQDLVNSLLDSALQNSEAPTH